MTESRLVPTPLGDARVVADLAARSIATLVLGHGAGGGVDARDLVALAAELPQRRISVLRIEQPWRVRGGRVAPAPSRLDIGWLAAMAQIRELQPGWLEARLVVGGRSAGARVACRTAGELGAVGVLALAFPLHPPGRPDKSRAAELHAVTVPVLVIQGERDPFGGPAELPLGPNVHVVAGGDHSLAVPARAALTQEETLARVVDAVDGWVRGLRLARSAAPRGSDALPRG